LHQKTKTHENAQKNTKSQLKIANLVNSIKDSEKPKKIFFRIMGLTNVHERRLHTVHVYMYTQFMNIRESCFQGEVSTDQ